ncbi:uncharacterized protein LOC129753403 [Uranotaenia lowii]|uniref:uncharacterized protein LOC129753403 n=1 Tax=Uranotaenia lowii TaxID=190385 RepID=UPI00247AB407|nr:uncharacterized protein LOC129753403 [Uranotaenia lowii]
MTYLENKNLLDERQFAFRKGKGTGAYFSNLAELLDQALKDDLHIDLAALDISKAYNRVWRHGATRSFSVAVGSVLSKEFEEQNGVPQGSVLAVSLFLVTMQSVFNVVTENVHVFVYADDILLVVIGRTPGLLRIRLQAAVRAVAKWCATVWFSNGVGKMFNLTYL